MTTVLSRGNATSITYQNTELSSILVSLEGSNNQHSVTNGVAFIRVSAGRMLLLDVNTLWGRRLVEIYAITFDQTNMFGMKFTSSNIDHTLDQALAGIGYSNMTPVSSLAAINAAQFATDSILAYLATGQLVQDPGTFATAPAQLKTIVAGTGLELVTDTSSVTLNNTGVASNPTYGTGVGNAVTLTWSTTDKLIFQGDISAVPVGDTTYVTANASTQMFVGLEGTTAQAISVLHFEQDHFEFHEANTIARLELKQSFLDALKQSVLDCITFSSDFMVDRSTPGIISVSHHSSYGGGGHGGGSSPAAPTYEWPSSFVANFDGNQSFETMIDTSNSGNQAGGKLPIDIIPSADNWTMQFDVNISSSQVNTYWYILAMHKQHDVHHNMQSQAIMLFEFQQYGWTLGTDASGGTGWMGTLPRNQWMTMTLVLNSYNLSLYIDGVLSAQLPSTYVTLGTIGDEGIRLAGTRDLPSRMVGQYRNFKIFDYAVL